MKNTLFSQGFFSRHATAPLCLLLGACATLGGGKGSSSGTATGAQLMDRNNALKDLALTAMKPCADKGKAEDRGLFVVSARPDGSITLGPAQWLGTAEMKQCMDTELPKARLPPWTGPTVTWLWSLNAPDKPAPKPLDAPPAGYDERQQEQVRRTQGTGNDTSTGPLSACAMRSSLGQEAYALVKMRLFIFPDGKVVGSTPIGNDADGKDAAYMDCLGDLVKDWSFPAFPAPGFTVMDIQLRYGVPPEDRGH